MNNFAVIALIEAENADDDGERELLIDLALEALQKGVERDRHPLCAAHMAAVFYLIGDRVAADEIANSTLADAFQAAHYHAAGEASESIGLVYLPPLFDRAASEATIGELFRSPSAHYQALIFLAQALVFTQPLMCASATGRRWLEFSVSLLSETPHTNLMLGLSHLHECHAEGLLYLHRAQQADPAAPNVLQALSLAYRDRGHLKNAELWKTVACACQFPELTTPPEWRWTEVDVDSSMTYVAYDDCTLAVESRLSSVSTSTLLAQGDWPEREIEFWRVWLKPDAIAIDVGADIGQFAISAAKRVGSAGRAIALEADPACMNCLKETQKVNRLDRLTLYLAIACDRNESPDWFADAATEAFGDDISNEGFDKWQTQPTSSAPVPPAPRNTVEHLTLDALMFREELPRVDFIRIDRAHCTLEMLAGATQLLSIFQPTLLFGLSPDIPDRNLTFGNALRAIGYKLYHYKPYVKQLVPIDSMRELTENLVVGANAIAIHPSQYDSVISLGYADAKLADEAALAELLLAGDPQ